MLATLFDREESLRVVARLARHRVRTRKVIRARALGATGCHGRLGVLQTDPERGLAFWADILLGYRIPVNPLRAWVICECFSERIPFILCHKFLPAVTSSVRIKGGSESHLLAHADGPERFGIRVRLPICRAHKRPNMLDS